MGTHGKRITRREALVLGSSGLLAAYGNPTHETDTQPEGKAPFIRTKPRKPNIIVYLSDTLRADHLGSYGFPKPSSPFLDEFCEESVVFEQCYSHAPGTVPAIGSICAGVTPMEHGIVSRENPERLGDGFRTMASEFRAAGYRTALFLANKNGGRDFGFARGYDLYRLAHAEGEKRQMDRVLSWLQEDAQEPFFLFVHALDPHSPYKPSPQEFESVHGATLEEMHNSLSRTDRRILKTIDGALLSAKDLSRDGVDYLSALYAAEIRGIDAQFERLLMLLRATSRLKNTVVACTSDHGESLGDHGRFCHGNYLYNEELHVPLVIRHPGTRNGTRVPWTAGHCDMRATLLGFAGISVSKNSEGAPLIDKEGNLSIEADRAVVSHFSYMSFCWAQRTLGPKADPYLEKWARAMRQGERPNRNDWACAMVKGRYKAIAPRHEGEIRLYDTVRDPGELHPVPQSEWKPAMVRFCEEFRAAAQARYERGMARAAEG